jgi:hypothetical protein
MWLFVNFNLTNLRFLFRMHSAVNFALFVCAPLRAHSNSRFIGWTLTTHFKKQQLRSYSDYSLEALKIWLGALVRQRCSYTGEILPQGEGHAKGFVGGDGIGAQPDGWVPRKSTGSLRGIQKQCGRVHRGWGDNYPLYGSKGGVGVRL